MISWGILSSYPAAVMAMAKGVGGEFFVFAYKIKNDIIWMEHELIF